MTSLRERNRHAAMEHIQTTAFGLFEAMGYPQVTIAAITQAAGVSESTFYRLFGTKEGLFTAVPWETGPVVRGKDVAEVAAALRLLAAQHTWPGMRWVVEQPEVRRAVLGALDEIATQLAEQIDPRGGRTGGEGLAATRALLFGVYLTALEQWYADSSLPYTTYYDRLLESSGLLASVH